MTPSLIDCVQRSTSLSVIHLELALHNRIRDALYSMPRTLSHLFTYESLNIEWEPTP
jgi:hypothetical protein